MTPAPLRIVSLPGYTPIIGHLVSMLDYTRYTTLEDVEGLTQAQLDYLLDADANSIGMLLEHIPSVEEYYQRTSLGLEPLDQTAERTRLGAVLGNEGRERIRGQPLEYYLERMATVRARTLEELAKLDDEWLLADAPFTRNRVANNYWKWFHVCEDELSHCRQIRLIRKRLLR